MKNLGERSVWGLIFSKGGVWGCILRRIVVKYIYIKVWLHYTYNVTFVFNYLICIYLQNTHLFTP